MSFESSVSVVTIPNKESYSERTKSSIWTQSWELEELAARNILEFQSEGWDYRKAIEEQDFVLYQDQLIHPVHVMRQCNLQRQFMMIMSGQRQYKQRYL